MHIVSSARGAVLRLNIRSRCDEAAYFFPCITGLPMILRRRKWRLIKTPLLNSSQNRVPRLGSWHAVTMRTCCGSDAEQRGTSCGVAHERIADCMSALGSSGEVLILQMRRPA